MQLEEKGIMFRNRLAKVYRHRYKMARSQSVGCFRIYDQDLPEFPFSVDRYEDRIYVCEYKRRHRLSEDEYEQWLALGLAIISEVTGVAAERIFLKLRQRKPGRLGQYQRTGTSQNEFVVAENGLRFNVNLGDYLDTGLFLDHRITRQQVREQSAGKRVLNLFCYTGSFSVYALAGGAAEVVSVDLSKTYLDWARRNVDLNTPEAMDRASFVHADAKQYLRGLTPGQFDLIVLDPPTFSNSKRMDDILDIQRDHVELINQCLHGLSPVGVLFFSTNFSKFRLDLEAIRARSVRDITAMTTPFDFAGKLVRWCYRVEK